MKRACKNCAHVCPLKERFGRAKFGLCARLPPLREPAKVYDSARYEYLTQPSPYPIVMPNGVCGEHKRVPFWTTRFLVARSLTRIYTVALRSSVRGFGWEPPIGWDSKINTVRDAILPQHYQWFDQSARECEG
jgi:hypothetical protein